MSVATPPALGEHPRQRALERYGITLDVAGLRSIETRLAAGEGMLLRRSPFDGSEVRVIRIAGQLVTVAFDIVTGHVKTFPPHPAALRATRKPAGRRP